MWITADIGCLNVPVDSASKNDNFMEKLFVNEPFALGYNSVKNLQYLKTEKHEYIKFFGEDCVEWFINETLEMKTYKERI